MNEIIWRCYCGNEEVERRADGNQKVTREVRMCELSCCPDGNYGKSPHYDNTHDREMERRAVEFQMFRDAMKGTTPLKGKGGRRKR